MPRTREQQDLTSVRGRTGLVYPSATADECKTHIGRLSRLLARPGNAERCQLDHWYADRDRLLEQLFYLLLVDGTPPDEAQA